MIFIRLSLLVPLVAISVGAGRAAEATPKVPPAPPLETHQFDFWIGEWEVTTPDGKIAGHSRIEPILDGRALQEHWSDGDGNDGTSLNIYEARAGAWHQFWVDRAGGVLNLTGTLLDGKMVFEGTRTSNGKVIVDRITWTPMGDGTVHQVWENSADDRKTWTTVFDGLYRKM